MDQKKRQPKYLLLLAFLSGVIFWVSWPVKPFGFLLLLAWIPILLIERNIIFSDYKRKGGAFFLFSFLALLIWNITTTWWVWFASDWGAVFAIVANSLLMSIPLLLFHHTKRRTNDLIGYSSFVFYYLAFEYFHLNWDLTWPWLTLGNGLSSLPWLIQWYEYTGHLGGSAWILISNVLIFLLLIIRRDTRRFKILTVTLSLFISLPVIASLIIWFTFEPTGKAVEIVVVQPNIDPYEEKFPDGERFIPYDQQLERLIRLSEEAVTENTSIVAWPETALPYDFWEHQLEHHPVIMRLRKFVKDHPGVTLVTGIDSYVEYEGRETPSTREIGGRYYDAFNSALYIDENGKLLIYHKSKLTPGVEGIPPAIQALTIDLGGRAGGLGKQADRSVFFDKEGIGAAPVICYESIFGEFVTDYVREGASLILIITNDGWWGDTPGHRQHLDYARMRAIETRLPIARSANTGISAFVNQRGEILEKTRWWEEDALNSTLLVKENQTFFVKYGDYFGRTASILSIAGLILLIASFFKKKKK